MESSLRQRTLKGVIWSGIERISVQGVQFLVMLVIARILAPKDFGLIGMLTVFLAVAQSLIDSGFSQALIRKQKRTEADNSTVFFFNIIVSIVIYLLLYIVAPWVSAFYEEPELTILMRVLCLGIIINAFGVVQRAIYTASLDFKTQARASFIAALVSGVFGIYLAVSGEGVWTLVWQQLLNACLNTVLLWMFSSWRPCLVYSWSSFRELFSFGSKLMASGLLDTVYSNIYLLVIGKLFSASSLGFYTQSKNFTQLTSANLTWILQRVTYPVLCSIQDDDERLKTDYRMLLKFSAFIIFPMMCLLAGVAYPLVDIVLGEKWQYTATLMIPLCFSMMLYPIHAINLNLLQVKGRSDLFLKLEIIKKIFGVFVLLISLPFGLYVMCWCTILSSFISLVINTYYTGKLINVGFFLQMQDLSNVIFASLFLFFISWSLTLIFNNTIIQLLLGGVIGLLSYITVVFLFRFEELNYLKQIINR